MFASRLVFYLFLQILEEIRSSRDKSSARAFRSSDFVIPSSFVIRASSFVSGRVVQFIVQPCPGKDPITSNCHGRDLQDLSDFVMIEAAEVFQFHDMRFS